MFIYCFDEETKIKLNSKGFRYINETTISGKTTYVFADNPNIKIEFEKGKILKTNRLNF